MASMFQSKTLGGWMGKKTRLIYMLSTRDQPQSKKYTQTKIKGWKRYFTQMEREK